MTRGELRAGLVAAALSGAPSTAHALLTRTDPLRAARAAGAIVAPRAGAPVQLAAAVPVHLALSLGWTAVLARTLPARHRVAAGAAAGLAIAALDLGVIGRRIPAVRALPLAPQVADHVAFGVTVAAALPTSVPSAARRRAGRPRR